MVKLAPDSTNNLSKVSATDCFQIRSLSQTRMVRKIGEITNADMREIESALAKVLKIN
jgi:mRNA interferase MazF